MTTQLSIELYAGAKIGNEKSVTDMKGRIKSFAVVIDPKFYEYNGAWTWVLGYFLPFLPVLVEAVVVIIAEIKVSVES